MSVETVVGGDAPSVVGRYGSTYRSIGWLYLVLAVLQGIAASFQRHSHCTFAVLLLVMGIGWLLVSPTQILDIGVRLPTVRPWRRLVSWADVEAIVRPELWNVDQRLTLRLIGGEFVPLTNVPIDKAAAIAALAGVPVEIQPPTHSPGRPAAKANDLSHPKSRDELDRWFARIEEQQRNLNRQLIQ